MNEIQPSSKPKSLLLRYWYLTIYLALILGFGIYNLLRTLLFWFYVTHTDKPFNPVIIAYFITRFAATCVFAIALLRFKKWGFYGLFIVMVSGLADTVILNLRLSGIGAGVAGFSLLSLFLGIGGNDCAWRKCK